MNKSREQFCLLLDDIESKQRALFQCHEYYRMLAQEVEAKKQRLANPEDYEDCEQSIARLNREYDKKINLLHEELNESLIKCRDLAEGLGREIRHDFNKLWDNMTNLSRVGVELDHIQREIECLRKAVS